MTRPLRGWPLWLVGWGLILSMTAQTPPVWEHYNAEMTPGLPGDEIQFLVPAREGGLWIGTLSGLARWQDGGFTVAVGGADRKPPLRVWAVYEPADGGLIIGHHQGVMVIDAHGAESNSLEEYSVAPIIPFAEGELWAIGTHRGTETSSLFVYDGTTWEPHPDASDLRVTNIMRTNKDRLWLTLEDNGVLEFAAGQSLVEATHHLKGLSIKTLTEDRRHRIWAGTWSRGVAVYDGTGWERHLAKQTAAAVLRIVQAANGDMWVATNASGLWHQPFNKQTWENHLADEGAINMLAASSDGRIWVSSQMVGGLRTFDGETWEVALDSPLPIRCFHEAEQAYWAGGILDGLHRLLKRR